MSQERQPYQILTPEGTIASDRELPASLHQERIEELYRTMVLAEELDNRMMKLQRQGRIGFYGEARGQYAAVVGSAAVLEDQDWVFPALREPAAALLRGFPLEKYIAQLFGTSNDTCEGRQMPCHYSHAEKNYVSMSSNIGTQLPQAAGAAWASKIREKNEVTIGYMGDGATSEGDFHVALNFSGVYDLPVVWFCQNNQFAISVPANKQTASENFAVKSNAYGFPGKYVDGNDLFAVYEVTRKAAERARNGEGPTLIEALTYRVGAHSSSDDPSRYRDQEEAKKWKDEKDPIKRLKSFMINEGFWSEERDSELRNDLAEHILTLVNEIEQVPPPERETMFEDVYEEMPDHLIQQRDESSL